MKVMMMIGMRNWKKPEKIVYLQLNIQNHVILFILKIFPFHYPQIKDGKIASTQHLKPCHSFHSQNFPFHIPQNGENCVPATQY